MNQRLKELDLMRAIAALSVIFIHVSGFSLSSGDIKIYNPVFILNQAARFAVPFFLIISGFVLHYAYQNGKSFSIFAYVLGRIKRVLIPYVFWTIVYILYALRNDLGLIREDKKGFLIFTGEQLVNGTAALHLYFVLIILQMYCLYPLLRKLMIRWPVKVLWTSFGVSVFFQTVVYAKLLKLSILPDYQYQILFPVWVFYFVFGMYLSGKINYFMESFRRYLFYLWIFCFTVVLADSLLTDTYSSSVRPGIMFYSSVSFMLFIFLIKKVQNLKSGTMRFLIWFSRQSYAVYLSHILLLKLVFACIHSDGKGFFGKNLIGILLVYGATVFLTSVTVYVFSRTPFAWVLGGVRTKKSE